MEIYTVSFFGHREVEGAAEIESRLERLLHDLITQKQYVEFLVGTENLISWWHQRSGELSSNTATATRR